MLVALLGTVTALATTHEVGPGESLYGIVAIHYPQDMNNWTGVAAQLVELNPDVLTEGMDTALQPGMVLRLLDEADNSAPPPVFSNKQDIQDVAEPVSQPSSTATDRPRASSSRNSTTQTTNTSSTPQTTDSTSSALTNPTNTAADLQAAGAKRSIGNITELRGSVILQRQNETQQLAVGDVVEAGDELRTTDRSTLTLSMTDLTMYRLEANTVVSLEDYAFDRHSGKGHAIITLVRGLVQVQSGQLAVTDGNELSINTVIATITIEGTEFALAMCSASNCDRNGLDINAGLYSGVIDGTITLQNNTGSRVSGAGEFLHIASVNSEAEIASNVASLLFTAEQLKRMTAAHDEEPLGFLGWLLSLFGGD